MDTILEFVFTLCAGTLLILLTIVGILYFTLEIFRIIKKFRNGDDF